MNLLSSIGVSLICISKRVISSQHYLSTDYCTGGGVVPLPESVTYFTDKNQRAAPRVHAQGDALDHMVQ